MPYFFKIRRLIKVKYFVRVNRFCGRFGFFGFYHFFICNVNICNINRTFCHRFTIEQEEQVRAVVHKRRNGEFIFYPLTIGNSALSVVSYTCIIVAFNFIQAEVMKRTNNVRLDYYVIITCVRTNILCRREIERRTIVIVCHLQYARFTFIAFKPRKVYSTFQSSLPYFVKIRRFIEIKDFIRINGFYGEYVKFFRCGVCHVRTVRCRYFHKISTSGCRCKLAVRNSYFRFRFVFYEIYLNFRCITFGEVLYLIRRQRIFFANFTVYTVVNYNVRSLFYVNVCDVHFTCRKFAVKHYVRVCPLVHEIGNGELIFYPCIINQLTFCASVKCAYFVHAEVYTISTALDVRFYDKVIITSIRAHILCRSKQEARAIVVVFCLQYARFAFIAFKPRKFHLTVSALSKLLKVGLFVKIKYFVRINRFRREYVKFFRCGVRHVRTVRCRYFHNISTCRCRSKLTVRNSYFCFRFAFYVIKLNFRRIPFGEVLYLERRQRVFFANLSTYCVIDGNKRNLFCINVSNVNRTFCHRFAIEHEEQVLAVFHKYGNGESVFYPFIVFNLTFIFIITVFFIQAQMMKRSINIRFQYDIGIISICVDVLCGNEMEVGTIVVICQFQYTRFPFIAFKPREGNSTR